MADSSEAIRAGKAFVELFVDNKRLVAGLKAARARMSAFAAGIGNIGARIAGVGAAMAAPFALSIKAASDMQETMNKFDVVFAGNTEAMKKWGDNFAGEVGRSQEQVARFLSGTQDLLVPIGFETGAAEQMSKDLTALAVDLASFNNLSDDAVLRDLHAAMTGSGEVMKKYGVIVSEAAVKQEMLNSGLDPKTATDQQKVMARMAIIMRGTTAAQGDALRSAGSYANQMKRLNAVFDDTKVTLGSAVLPLVTDLVTAVAGAVKVAGEWISKNQGVALSLAKGAAAVLALGVGLLIVSKLLALAAFGFGVLATVIGLLPSLTGIAVIAAGVAGLAAVTGTTTDNMRQKFGALGEFVGGVWDSIKGTATTAIGAIVDKIKAGDLEGAFKVALSAVKLMFFDVVAKLTEAWMPWIGAIRETWTNAVASMAKGWNNFFSTFDAIAEQMGSAMVSAAIAVGDAWDATFKLIQKGWRLAQQAAINSIADEDDRAKAQDLFDFANSLQDDSEAETREERDKKKAKADEAALLTIEANRQAVNEKIDTQRDADNESSRADTEEAIAAAKARAVAPAAAFAEAVKPGAAAAGQGPQLVSGAGAMAGFGGFGGGRGADRRLVLERRMQQARESFGTVLNENSGNVGTFSGRAAGQLGSTSVFDRVAKAAEETAKNTGRTANKIDGLIMEAE